jgi:xanthine/uracil permease
MQHYVDWYKSHLLYLIVSVLLLSCADALLALSLLKLSGREINTFMAMLIDFDVQLFAALKMGLISAGLLFLLIYHWLRIFWRLRVDHVLPAVLLLYLMLIGYELMLLEPSRAPAPTKLIVVMGMALAVMSLCFDFTRSKAKVSAWTDRNIR